MATIKLNLNVPLVGLNNDPIEQPKKNKRGDEIITEDRLDKHGKPIFERDEKGNVIFDKNEKGEPVEPRIEQQEVYEIVQLKDVIGNAVGNRYESDKDVNYSPFLQRGKLAKKIVNSSTANYTHDDIKTIEEYIAMNCGTIVAAQFDEILNGKDEELADDSGKKNKEKAA